MEPGHGQCLLESLTETGGGAGMVILEMPGQVPQLLLGLLGVGLLPGLVQLAADEGALVLGQVVEHISPLVLTATGDQDALAKGGLECRADGLAAVRSEEHTSE